MVWYSHLFKNFPQFVVIHKVKGFGLVNKAKVDVFLELSCFFDDPEDVGNLISVSFAFSKTSLYMEVHGSHIAEAWLGELRALFCYRVRRVQLCSSLNILWQCLSLGLE